MLSNILITLLTLVLNPVVSLNLTPINLQLLSDQRILELCLGNFYNGELPSKKSLMDSFINLKPNQKVQCGSRKGPNAKPLIGALMLKDGLCSKFGLFNNRVSKDKNLDKGVNNDGVEGGINLIVNDIHPGCFGKNGYSRLDNMEDDHIDRHYRGPRYPPPNKPPGDQDGEDENSPPPPIVPPPPFVPPPSKPPTEVGGESEENNPPPRPPIRPPTPPSPPPTEVGGESEENNPPPRPPIRPPTPPSPPPLVPPPRPPTLPPRYRPFYYRN